MGDIIADAAVWLDGMRREHLSRAVTYTRGSVSVVCLATVSRSNWETQNELGVVERWESRDFIISTSEMPYSTPQRGDRLIETVGGVAVTYEVGAPRGVPFWQYADLARTSVRLHTKAVA